MNKPSYDLQPGLDNLPKPHQSAFPHPHVFGTYEEGDRIATGGMTLRAYMAARAPAAPEWWWSQKELSRDCSLGMMCKWNVAWADALIEELAK